MNDPDMSTQQLQPSWSVTQRTIVSITTRRTERVRHDHFWRPPTDLFETEDAFVVRVEIAGMRSEDFVISLENRRLTVRGARPNRAERGAYHQMEICFGEFATEIELPGPVAEASISAEYSDGFLRVALPKQLPHNISLTD